MKKPQVFKSENKVQIRVVILYIMCIETAIEITIENIPGIIIAIVVELIIEINIETIIAMIIDISTEVNIEFIIQPREHKQTVFNPENINKQVKLTSSPLCPRPLQ